MDLIVDEIDLSINGIDLYESETPSIGTRVEMSVGTRGSLLTSQYTDRVSSSTVQTKHWREHERRGSR